MSSGCLAISQVSHPFRFKPKFNLYARSFIAENVNLIRMSFWHNEECLLLYNSTFL